MEAMAMGKPVMCYIMKEVFEAGLPVECPVINTNPDNLKEQLIKLISNAQLRHDIGKQSRAFAEDYFDIEKIANYLADVYKSAHQLKNPVNA
jgi:glycosyltransferase involved in cell wall biosynthesis